MPRQCSIEGCDRPHWIKGNCRVHHERIKKWGTPHGGPTTHAPPEVRFWRYVDKRGDADCWEWTGKRQHSGYGGFGITTTKRVLAHRYSYELANHGFSPPVVMHTCDNPACVNPAHLRAGTMKANYDDMVAKGRLNRTERKRGSEHHKARVTETEVRAIRASTDKLDILAERYGLTRSATEKIKYRQTWKHIE